MSESNLERKRYSSVGADKYIVTWDKKNTECNTPLYVDALSEPNKCYQIFLKRHTCYDLIPVSAKLVVFDVTLNVKKAFYALIYNGVRVAILWDSQEQRHIGLLTITDFIRILHKSYRSPTSPMTELEDHQIKTWREQLTDYQRPLIYITPERTLLHAVRMLLHYKVHRLPVIDPVSGNPLHILTHKRVLRYLQLNLSQLPTPSFMGQTLQELGVGTLSGVVTVQENCPLHKALQYFIDYRVSALPVVDSGGHLVDIYAKFDVINLAATRTYGNLDINVHEALKYRRDNLAATRTYGNLDINVHEALKYRRDKFHGVTTCQLDETLETVVNRIAEAGVHRLVVVKEEKVVGIVSLSDLLRFIIAEHEMEPFL